MYIMNVGVERGQWIVKILKKETVVCFEVWLQGTEVIINGKSVITNYYILCIKLCRILYCNGSAIELEKSLLV